MDVHFTDAGGVGRTETVDDNLFGEGPEDDEIEAFRGEDQPTKMARWQAWLAAGGDVAGLSAARALQRQVRQAAILARGPASCSPCATRARATPSSTR